MKLQSSRFKLMPVDIWLANNTVQKNLKPRSLSKKFLTVIGRRTRTSSAEGEASVVGKTAEGTISSMQGSWLKCLITRMKQHAILKSNSVCSNMIKMSRNTVQIWLQEDHMNLITVPFTKVNGQRMVSAKVAGFRYGVTDQSMRATGPTTWQTIEDA